ncbi:hypothetical protein AAP_01832 [Ascosphaera apis ARSEF 7405]|uniref:Uncharacterized protein n=1 Tax=Ascosphaera apis ARSEF 7405 TaxID=392613 RepID=A0A162II26_9EURO|nr:hypothetical protein AAP_01832 [Ascosphaera apis ARSEF 7405]
MPQFILLNKAKARYHALRLPSDLGSDEEFELATNVGSPRDPKAITALADTDLEARLYLYANPNEIFTGEGLVSQAGGPSSEDDLNSEDVSINPSTYKFDRGLVAYIAHLERIAHHKRVVEQYGETHDKFCRCDDSAPHEGECLAMDIDNWLEHIQQSETSSDNKLKAIVKKIVDHLRSKLGLLGHSSH